MSNVPLVVNGEPMTIDAPNFCCLVHQQGIRVDVVDSVEINSRTTIDVMSKMSQRAWVHISTGELFQHLFKIMFDEESGIKIPETIEQLNKGDFGVIHVCGMIVQGCEAIFEKKTRLFFRNPEDTLHPKQERLIVSMLQEMMKLLGQDGEVQTATEEPNV